MLFRSTGEQPKNVPNMLALLSALRALSRPFDSALSSIKFALVATPTSVPVVSKRFTNRKDIITVNMPILSAPKISSFKSVGAILGGDEITPLNLIRSAAIAIMVIINIPMIIAPGIFLIEKAAIIRNPKAASSVSIFEKSPRANNVASLAIIMPPQIGRAHV